MWGVSTTRFVGGLAVAFVFAAIPVLSAAPVCERQAERRPAVMRCRGGLSMGGQATSLEDGRDLKLYFRDTRGEDHDGSTLEPGACIWAARAVRPDEPHIVVLPMNGPLADTPYSIGHQARACAADNQCTMEFCAYDAGDELRAVDGFIRLAFGGRH